MSERDPRIGKVMPLLPSDFFTENGEPLSVLEFIELWRSRGGDEAHLQAILHDLGEVAEDLMQRSQSTVLH